MQASRAEAEESYQEIIDQEPEGAAAAESEQNNAEAVIMHGEAPAAEAGLRRGQTRSDGHIYRHEWWVTGDG